MLMIHSSRRFVIVLSMLAAAIMASPAVAYDNGRLSGMTIYPGASGLTFIVNGSYSAGGTSFSVSNLTVTLPNTNTIEYVVGDGSGHITLTATQPPAAWPPRNGLPVLLATITPPGKSVTAATVASGGSGCNTSDFLTVVGGTGTPAILQITAVSGAAVTSVAVSSGTNIAGMYKAVPNNPVATTAIGSTGPCTGVTLNLTTASPTASHFSWVTLYPPVDNPAAQSRKAAYDAGFYKIPGKDFQVGLPANMSPNDLTDLTVLYGVRNAWSGVAKSPNITLSNGNLMVTQTATTATYNEVRGIKGDASAKRYFEVTMTTAAAGRDGVGVGDSRIPIANFYLGVAHSIGYFSSGAVYVLGTAIATIQSYAAGDVIGIAVDANLKLIWFKNLTTGSDWNNSASANPAAGTGGIPIGGLAGALYPAWNGYNTNDTATANFSSTGLTGSVPAGFYTYDQALPGVPYWDAPARALRFNRTSNLEIANAKLIHGMMYWRGDGGANFRFRNILADLAATDTDKIFASFYQQEAANTMPDKWLTLEDSVLTDSTASFGGGDYNFFFGASAIIRRTLIENLGVGVNIGYETTIEDVQFRHIGLYPGDHGNGVLAQAIAPFVDNNNYGGYAHLNRFDIEAPTFLSPTWDGSQTTAAFSIQNFNTGGLNYQNTIVENGRIDGGTFSIATNTDCNQVTKNIIYRNIWFTRNYAFEGFGGIGSRVLSFHPQPGSPGCYANYQNVIFYNLFWEDTGEVIQFGTPGRRSGITESGPLQGSVTSNASGAAVLSPLPTLDPIYGQPIAAVSR